MNIFLDTNAVVKLYHQENGTDNLTDFLTLHQSDLIITISDLTKIELHSTFLKRVRMKQIDLKAVYQALSHLTATPKCSMSLKSIMKSRNLP
jgi:predicted nucleic acid-binding protein